MSAQWRVAWSHQFDGLVAALGLNDAGVVAAVGREVRALDSDGGLAWHTGMPFRPYAIATDDANVGVLAGNGFMVLNALDGQPLHEGRATPGGFADVLARPAGGWVLSDREGQLHIFNTEGKGVRRISCGRIRRLIGWMDREHLLIHDGDGCIRCVRLMAEATQRKVEDRVWSWSTRLQNGRLLLQSTEGALWVGSPNPFGWNELGKIRDVGVEPLDAAWTAEGWWMLEMDGGLTSIFDEEQEPLRGGDLMIGNSLDVLVTSTRQGLLRFMESSGLDAARRIRVSRDISEKRQHVDWQQRKTVFLSACEAEDAGDLSSAIELYQSLGRQSDVKRLLAMREEGG